MADELQANIPIPSEYIADVLRMYYSGFSSTYTTRQGRTAYLEKITQNPYEYGDLLDKKWSQ